MAAISNQQPGPEDDLRESQLDARPTHTESDGLDACPSHKESDAFTTFEDPTLRRAAPIGTVLASFGRVLANNAGSAHTFAMSRPVLQVGAFISHNWSTGRAPKFLTLAYHFNLTLAVAVSTGGALVVGLLLALRVIEPQPATVVVESTSWQCWATANALFLLCFLFGHEALRPFGFGTDVFLDKLCIHQTDPDIQRKGIESLSAYLLVSKKVLIVYTDTYLHKLWTVYELASALILKSDPRIDVVPTCYVWMFMTLFGGTSFASAVLTVGLHVGTAVPLAALYSGLALLSLSVTSIIHVQIRSWSRQRAQISSIVDAFDIRNAKCFVESDRQTVERNVALLMREYDYVPQDAELGACLDAFNLMVRELVPEYLRKSFGRSGIPWRLCYGSFPGFLGFGLDFMMSNNQGNKNMYGLAGAFWLTYLCAVLPLALAFSSWLSSQMLHLGGRREVAFVAGVFLPVGNLGGVMLLSVLLGLFMFANYGPVMTALYYAFCAALVGVSVWVFWVPRVQVNRWGDLKRSARMKTQRYSSLQVPQRELDSHEDRAEDQAVGQKSEGSEKAEEAGRIIMSF